MRRHWTEVGRAAPCFANAWPVLVFAALLLVIVPIHATGQVGGSQTVRGQVLWGPNQPAVGVPVNLYMPDLGDSGYSYTDWNGMYYLYNIPFGEYTLQVWDYPGRPPITYSIVVQPTTSRSPFTDIFPIVIR